jgi:hypothetical protein
MKGDFKMGFNFTCPYCQTKTTINQDRLVEQKIKYTEKKEYKMLKFSLITCPNELCERTTILMESYFVTFIYGSWQKVGETIKIKRIEPEFSYIHYPDYIPEQIRQDYEEACKIVSLSPKASATLSRRCLQGMIRDFHNVEKKNLVDEINAIKNDLGTDIFSALHNLRSIGNIGAHPERDINLIVEIDEGEAQKLIKFIELLMDKWYIKREEERKMLEEINQIAIDKQNEKKGIEN